MTWHPAGILFNEKKKTYHPIIFKKSPPPSWDSSEAFCRFKSMVHHTDGFKTVEEAEKSIEESYFLNTINVGVIWNWNGEGIPAMIEWFTTKAPNVKIEKQKQEPMPFTPEWVEKNIDDVRKYFGYDK